MYTFNFRSTLSPLKRSHFILFLIILGCFIFSGLSIVRNWNNWTIEININYEKEKTGISETASACRFRCYLRSIFISTLLSTSILKASIPFLRVRAFRSYEFWTDVFYSFLIGIYRCVCWRQSLAPHMPNLHKSHEQRHKLSIYNTLAVARRVKGITRHDVEIIFQTLFEQWQSLSFSNLYLVHWTCA